MIEEGDFPPVKDDQRLTILFVPWPKSLGRVMMEPDTRYGNSISLYDYSVSVTGYNTQRWKRVRIKPAKRNLKVNAGIEYENKNRHWITFYQAKNKDIYEIWYTGKESSILLSLSGERSRFVSIYIRGHHESNERTHGPVIMSPPLNVINCLSSEKVVKRLIKSGLQQGFQGKIKLYNCHSGHYGASNYARGFVSEIRENGYWDCPIFAYRGALDSFPGATNTNYKTTKLLDSKIERASLHRLLICEAGSNEFIEPPRPPELSDSE